MLPAVMFTKELNRFPVEGQGGGGISLPGSGRVGVFHILIRSDRHGLIWEP